MTTRPLRSHTMAFLCAALVLTAAGPSRAAGVAPGQATPVQREQAQSRFLRGKALFGQKKYDEALAELNASLDIVASPNTRLYVARCLRESGKLVAAYVELGRAMVEAKELARDDARYQKAADAAQEERAQLEPKLGFVDVDVEHAAPTTTLKVGSSEVRRGGWKEPVPVMPGTTDIVVETPGHAPIQRTMTLGAGEKKAVAIDAGADTPAVADLAPTTPASSESEPSDRTKLRPLAYVAGGVALVGLGTFLFMGAKANSTYSDLQKACGSSPCPPGHEDAISSGRTQQTIANVGLGVFVVGAAGSVVLFVLTRPKAPAAPAGATAQVSLAAGPSFVGLKGGF